MVEFSYVYFQETDLFRAAKKDINVFSFVGIEASNEKIIILNWNGNNGKFYTITIVRNLL